MSTASYELNIHATAYGGRMITVAFTSSVWDSLPKGVSRHIPPVTSPAQAYYWTNAWQAREMESLAELGAGHGRTFDDPKEAIRWLLN